MLAIFLAVASTLVCTAALGTRTLTSLDLGYHLAYGEQALATGRLVDHNPYLYALPPQDLAAGRSPRPGSWELVRRYGPLPLPERKLAEPAGDDRGVSTGAA